MAEDILSQEEVEALLRGVGTESEPAGTEPAQPGGVRPYAIGREARIVRARMPGLELVGERFAHGLREALAELLYREVHVTPNPISVVEYAAFLRRLATPMNLNLVQIRPMRGVALMTFDRRLVLHALDGMFGGQGRVAARETDREMTPMELRIDRRLLQVVFDTYAAAWQPLQAFEFRQLRSESSARFANIAAPGEAVVVTGCSIDLGGGAADFQLCIPYAMLEPIRDLLYGGPPTARRDADGRWSSALSAQLYATEVELTAKLASTEIALWQLLALQVGDVIALDLPDTLVAEVDGVPLLQCRYGVVNGQYALKVERAMGAEPAGQ